MVGYGGRREEDLAAATTILSVVWRLRFGGTKTPPTRPGTCTGTTDGRARIVTGCAAAEASTGSSSEDGAGSLGGFVRTSGTQR
jgi:hypothetical protein